MGETGSLDELKQRLRELEDRNAILDTLHRYGHALDHGDEELWLRCWHDDAALHWPRLGWIKGREAFLSAFRQHSHAPEEFHKHLVVDPLIDISGDTAKVDSYFALLHTEPSGPFVYTFGRYRDQFVRCEDGWRIIERKLEVEARHNPS